MSNSGSSLRQMLSQRVTTSQWKYILEVFLKKKKSWDRSGSVPSIQTQAVAFQVPEDSHVCMVDRLFVYEAHGPRGNTAKSPYKRSHPLT